MGKVRNIVGTVASIGVPILTHYGVDSSIGGNDIADIVVHGSTALSGYMTAGIALGQGAYKSFVKGMYAGLGTMYCLNDVFELTADSPSKVSYVLSKAGEYASIPFKYLDNGIKAIADKPKYDPGIEELVRNTFDFKGSLTSLSKMKRSTNGIFSIIGGLALYRPLSGIVDKVWNSTIGRIPFLRL